jgi:uncharacterized protein YpmB
LSKEQKRFWRRENPCSKVNNILEKALIMRIFVVIILAIACTLLFYVEEIKEPKLKEQTSGVVQQSYTLAEVDSVVEKVLEKFQIDKSWVKRTEITVTGSGQKRIERKVAIPPDIIPALMNVEFKRMVDNYNLQVSATENLKENMVTIHIHDNRKIIETIILKIIQTPKKQDRKEKAYQRSKT